ncbi:MULTISPECIES: Abi family protein [unclassified Microbacterium]|uniref:Abi family protein n=1 Tax=unclassified Microbacterium TaxID=2609290 RepID=UPI003019672F
MPGPPGNRTTHTTTGPTERGQPIAAEILQRINYYRLSGYWYPFRQKTTDGRGDHFYPGVVPRSVV